MCGELVIGVGGGGGGGPVLQGGPTSAALRAVQTRTSRINPIRMLQSMTLIHHWLAHVLDGRSTQTLFHQSTAANPHSGQTPYHGIRVGWGNSGLFAPVCVQALNRSLYRRIRTQAYM